MVVLVTGGTGYIGSHTVVELLNAGFEVVIIDDLSNSSIKVLDKIELITKKRPHFYQFDLANQKSLTKVFISHKIDVVIHFAAYKAVCESAIKPLAYYKNNVISSLVLFDVMQKYQVNKIVFSSSATVYGNPEINPITEDFPTYATSPYGYTKIIIEQILGDMYIADNNLNIAILRYFNPVGAHSSGFIGDNPNGIPNNLMPYIAQVATGKLKYLNIYGNDYPTHDGTGVRDYIHVIDLALGHLSALDYLNSHSHQILTINLGTGIGYSVLDVIASFEKVSGKKIPYKVVSRRMGDVATCYTDPTLANKILGFKAQYGIDEMCKDSWNYQNKNPDGY